MAKKYLWLAITLSITIILCITHITLSNKGRAGVNSGTAAFDDAMSTYSDVKYSMYDDSSASGAEIIALIKGLTADDGITIKVQNGASTTATAYSYITVKNTDGSLKQPAKDITDKTKTNSFINSNASFKSTVERDANDIITAVTFIQIK